MAMTTGGQLVAKMLKKEGVRHIFTLCGLHVAPIYAGCVEEGIQVIDMRLIDELGVPALMRRLLEDIAGRNGRVHVSLDVDFLDPSLAPGVGTPVPGGVT